MRNWKLCAHPTCKLGQQYIELYLNEKVPPTQTFDDTWKFWIYTCNSFHKISQRVVSCYMQKHHYKPMKRIYPDPNLSCNDSVTDSSVTWQCIIERGPDWFDDIAWNTSCWCTCNMIPFPFTCISKIYVLWNVHFLTSIGRKCVALVMAY